MAEGGSELLVGAMGLSEADAAAAAAAAATDVLAAGEVFDDGVLIEAACLGAAGAAKA